MTPSKKKMATFIAWISKSMICHVHIVIIMKQTIGNFELKCNLFASSDLIGYYSTILKMWNTWCWQSWLFQTYNSFRLNQLGTFWDFQTMLPLCPMVLWFMVFNATFNNISVIVAETGVLERNHRPVASHWQTLSHNVVSRTPPLSSL